jgi:ribose transport system substrate-binding protein
VLSRIRLYTQAVKLLVRVGLYLFGILAVAAFSLSLTLVRTLYVRGTEEDTLPPKYHFSIYLPENRNSFFAEIIRGAEKAARESDAVLSIHAVEPDRHELEMASYTGVDGVIVCPYLEHAFARKQLEKLRQQDIPVVLINHNVPGEQPWPYIGTNNFDVGRKMGAIAGRIPGGEVRLALVYSEKAPGVFDERELVEMGITDALRDRLSGPILSLKTDSNPLDAEETIYRLFKTTPHINTIIFTDASDTIAAAQVIIDMNLVGRVRIIGAGNDPGILEYIRKGIVAGSIVVNPERIGHQAVKSLLELHTTGYTSTSVDTGVQIVDGSGG